VIACAALAAESDGRGGTRLTTVRSEAPLALRQSADAVYLVGAAGGPLGGDEMTLEVDVGPGASVDLRTAAASVVLPGPLPSRLVVRARVGAGGSLRWHPQPTVVARRCRHEVLARLELEAGACVEWWEELVLGRHGEPPGSVAARLDVDHDGAALLRHSIALGPDHPSWTSPAVTGGARAYGSLLVVGAAAAREAVVLGPTAALLPLEGPATHTVALAADVISLRRLLEAGILGATMAPDTLLFTDDPEANRLLATDPFALLIGMLLDQQVPMEKAFHSPFDLKERLGGRLDVAAIAEVDPAELAALFAQRPALHRFPGSMASRTQDLARALVERFDGQAERVWTTAATGQELFANLRALPGFGEQKARIFVALLAKRLGIMPPGWDAVAGPYGRTGWFSVADIDGPESLARVREHKRAVKAEAKAAKVPK